MLADTPGRRPGRNINWACQEEGSDKPNSPEWAGKVCYRPLRQRTHFLQQLLRARQVGQVRQGDLGLGDYIQGRQQD